MLPTEPAGVGSAEELPEGERDLAALVHRLASPLGAVTNYVHLLQAGQAGEEARRGMLDALAGAQALLRSARRLLDALETARLETPPDGADLRAALAAARELTDDAPMVEAPALPRAGIPEAAARRLFQALLAGAGGETLRLRLGEGPGLHLCVTGVAAAQGDAGAEHALLPFTGPSSGAAAGGELALGAALVRRLGGRAWLAPQAHEGTALHVVLPAAGSRARGPREDARP